MSSSRLLLISIVSALAISLALFVVLSPGETDPIKETDETGAPASPLAGITVPAAADNELPGGDPEFAHQAQREAAPTLLEEVPAFHGPQARISFHVFGPTGSPIVGATVRGASLGPATDFETLEFLDWERTSGPSLSLFGSAVSSNEGHVEIFVPTETRLLLELTADGFATALCECQALQVDQELLLKDVHLQQAGELRIEVFNADSKPCPDLSILSWSGGDNPTKFGREFAVRQMLRCTTDEQGIAHFRGLPDIPSERFEIWGEDLQSPTNIEMLGPTGNEASYRRYTLPPEGVVRGRVVGQDGEPLANINVLVLDPSQAMNWVDPGGDRELEESLKQRPGIDSAMGFGMLTLFGSQETDANGNFEKKYFLDPESAKNRHLLFAAIAIVDQSLIVESTFHRAEDEITLVVPRTWLITGRVLNDSKQPFPGVQLQFRARDDLLEKESQDNQSDNGIWLTETSVIKTDSGGNFSAQLPANHYWIEAMFPGGRVIFEGPFDLREGDLNLGDLEISIGHSVVLTAVPTDGSAAIGNLRGTRDSVDDEDDYDLFTELEPQPAIDGKSAWQVQKNFILQKSQSAEITGLLASWKNETEGEWEYALTAPGWVPAFVVLEIEADSSPTRLDVPMTRAGEVIVRVLTTNGEAPEGLVLELVPARGSPIHPEYERRIVGISEQSWLDHDRQPVDADSRSHFTQVLPGQYEVFAMSSADADSWFDPGSENRTAIANIEVSAGARIEVDASIANLAELTVLVLRNGVPVKGAQVFAESIPKGFGLASLDFFGFSFGSRDPQGVTNAQGQLVLPSLTPESHYQLGARITEIHEDNWDEGDAWTCTMAKLVSGPQSITIEIGAGGVRMQVNGDPSARIEVTLARLRELSALAEDATEQEKHLFEMNAKHRAAQTQRDLIGTSTVATRVAQGGMTLEFLGLEPGTYQVMLATESGNARGFSKRFDVAEKVVDLGALGMSQLGQVKIQLLGTDQLNDENRFDIELRCIASGSDRVVESTRWLQQDGELDWYLPTGSYFLQVRQEEATLGNSPTFTVSSGATTPFSWQMPVLQTRGG